MFLVVDDGVLERPEELGAVDELLELCEGASAREVHGVCAFGTRLRFYTADTRSRVVSRGPSGGWWAAEDAMCDLDVVDEEGLRTLCEYVQQGIEDRIEHGERGSSLRL